MANKNKTAIKNPILFLVAVIILIFARSVGEMDFFKLRNSSGREEAVVERVVDGDTIILENGEKVRLIGIDTPETVKPGTKPEYYGKEASDFTKKKLEGKKVYLEKDVSDSDRYGRLLRYVYLEEDVFFNLELVKEGYANVATYPPDVKYADDFLEAERAARENGKGLWNEEAY